MNFHAVEHDPFNGPDLESVRECNTWEKVARSWCGLGPYRGSSTRVRLAESGTIDIDRLRQSIYSIVQSNSIWRAVLAPNDALCVITDGAGTVCFHSFNTDTEKPEQMPLNPWRGPLINLSTRVLDKTRWALDLELHAFLGNELRAFDLLTAISSNYAGRSIQPTETLLAGSPIQVRPIVHPIDLRFWSENRIGNETFEIDLAKETLDILMEYSTSQGCSVDNVIRDIWAMYLAGLSGYQSYDLALTRPEKSYRNLPGILSLEAVTLASDQALDDMRDYQWPAFELLEPTEGVEHLVISLQPEPVDFRELNFGGGMTSLNIKGLPPGSDIHVRLVRGAETDKVDCTYNATRISEAFAKYRIQGFISVLEQLINNSEKPMRVVNLLSKPERDKILRISYGKSLKVPEDKSVEGLIRNVAERDPTLPAIQCDNNVLSYGELVKRVDDCCNWLDSHGIQSGQRIGILVEQSPELIVAILSVLSIGCTYVPLDGKLPARRLEYICKDAGLSAIITDKTFLPSAEKLPAPALRIGYKPGAYTKRAYQLSWPAYIIYTSGSTGTPKGVIISRKALLHHNVAILQDFSLKTADRVLQFANPCFDVAAEEIFPSLVAGATLVLLPNKSHLSMEEFNEFLCSQDITVANLPAAYWHEWVRYLSSNTNKLSSKLRLLIAGSDRVSPQALKIWQSLSGNQVEFRNGYGPTETTITATLYSPEQHAATDDNVPIGKPVANMQALIVRNDSLVPFGMRGELHLSGPQLADGYVGRADLNETVFVTHAASGENQRWYRTGDEARLLPDGNIEFLGRADHQVKINGFRIELGEIERSLESIPGVKQTAALVRDGLEGTSLLMAYYSTEEDAELSEEDARRSLAKTLPPYMVPSRLMKLQQMPMTPSGKVDRRRLPSIVRTRPSLITALVRPTTERERQIMGIWQSALELDEVGVLDNFFDVGGSSMIALRVIESIAHVTGKKLTAAQFFQHPTIRELAKFLEQGEESSVITQGAPPRGKLQRIVVTRMRSGKRG